jgi:hypothetical protein
MLTLTLTIIVFVSTAQKPTKACETKTLCFQPLQEQHFKYGI